jgi:hypothetical protein
MAHRVCPWWLGYWLACPLRQYRQDPIFWFHAWHNDAGVYVAQGKRHSGLATDIKLAFIEFSNG